MAFEIQMALDVSTDVAADRPQHFNVASAGRGREWIAVKRRRSEAKRERGQRHGPRLADDALTGSGTATSGRDGE